MRIALVVSGGVDRSGREHVIPVVLSLVERLARRHALTVYALQYHDEPRTYPLLGATIHDLGRPRGFARRLTALVRRLRRDGPFDVIHGYWAAPAGIAAAAAGRLLGIPSVVTLNSGELASLPQIQYGLERNRRTRLVLAGIGHLADRTMVCTEQMARRAHDRGLSPALIPIGVDTSVFIPAARDAGVPFRLLHVADLNPVKDQRTLVRAIRRVVDAESSTHLDIVGRDTLGGAIQAYARDLGIVRQVTFHGSVPTDRIVAFYQRAHLLVMSSLHEGGGIVVLEAAACSLPTVGTAVGHIADFAPDRAVAVPIGDGDALGDAILALLRNPAQRDVLAERARAWALEHDIDWTVARLQELYADTKLR